MSANMATGLQHISDLIYATDIKDAKEFNQFCQKELQDAEKFINMTEYFGTLPSGEKATLYTM